MTQRIAVLIPYFGPWPVWIDFFIESCRANGDIDWILFGDAEPPENRASNVRHVRLSFDEYKSRLSEAFGRDLSGIEPYKLCDFKPALAFVHAELVRGYDFVAFGDLDVVYGQLRAFLDEEMLAAHDIVSNHSDRVSGHLCMMRNAEEVVTLFQRVPGWKAALRSADYVCFDERRLFNALRGRPGWLNRRAGAPHPALFRETYSTPAATDGMRWYWRGGRLTNEFYPHHPFMYLHFMSWHSSRWLDSQEHVRSGAAAPWTRLDRVVQVDWRSARESGFMISAQGIQPLELPSYG